jgi:hypothetical protein
MGLDLHIVSWNLLDNSSGIEPKQDRGPSKLHEKGAQAGMSLTIITTTLFPACSYGHMGGRGPVRPTEEGKLIFGF